MVVIWVRWRVVWICEVARKKKRPLCRVVSGIYGSIMSLSRQWNIWFANGLDSDEKEKETLERARGVGGGMWVSAMFVTVMNVHACMCVCMLCVVWYL